MGLVMMVYTHSYRVIGLMVDLRATTKMWEKKLEDLEDILVHISYDNHLAPNLT